MMPLVLVRKEVSQNTVKGGAAKDGYGSVQERGRGAGGGGIIS